MRKNSQIVLNKLKTIPDFRERKNKNVGIASIINELHPAFKIDHPDPQVRKKIATSIVKEILSMDRAWRKLTRDNKELRGSDYEDGYKLAVKEMDKLGYRV